MHEVTAKQFAEADQNDGQSGIAATVDSKTVRVVLFKPNGRYCTEESWAVPADADGPWSMNESPDFRRISGGPVLIESQEPWGYPHLFPAATS